MRPSNHVPLDRGLPHERKGTVNGTANRRPAHGAGRRTVSSGGKAAGPVEGDDPTSRVNRGVAEGEETFEAAISAAREGRREEAIELYRTVLQADPNHLGARNNVGILLDEGGLHDMALEHFRAALEVDPDNPSVLTNLGATLGSLGRYPEGERALDRAIGLDPEGVGPRVNLAVLHYRRGLYARAERELQTVCKREAGHVPALFYRGKVLNRLGRVDEALASLERAARLDPSNAEIFYLMGVLYDQKHLPEEAAVMYRRARELSGS